MEREDFDREIIQGLGLESLPEATQQALWEKIRDVMAREKLESRKASLDELEYQKRVAEYKVALKQLAVEELKLECEVAELKKKLK